MIAALRACWSEEFPQFGMNKVCSFGPQLFLTLANLVIDGMKKAIVEAEFSWDN